MFLPRFFLALKYHFLNGYANRRLDDLLLLLSERVQAYYRYILVHSNCAGIHAHTVQIQLLCHLDLFTCFCKHSKQQYFGEFGRNVNSLQQRY